MDIVNNNISSPRTLSNDELEFYHKHGYLIVKNVFNDSDFKEFEDDYAKLIDIKAKELFEQKKITDLKKDLTFQYRFAAIAEQCNDEVFHKDIIPFCRRLDCMFARTKGFMNFMFNKKLLFVVESIVGPEITVNPIQHVRAYLPARNGQHNRNLSEDGSGNTSIAHPALAPWHQDQGVTREEADQSEILTTWTPLFDVGIATGLAGPLQVMPNRIKDGLLPHIRADYGTTIDTNLIKKNEVGVNCVMKRGDVLFIHRFTPHRGTLNLSNYVRWSIDLRFQKTGTPTGRHFWPEFIAKTAAADQSIIQNDYETWKKRWIHDLEHSKGERWHRVADSGDF